MAVETGELIVAHGARMSWAGLLRPGDEFGRFRKARVVTLTTPGGPPLARYYGAWSERYRRFTSNLSSPHLRIHAEATSGTVPGIRCLLFWVDRAQVRDVGPGSVCRGDGWPVEFWTAFTAYSDRLPGASLAERLLAFLRSDLGADLPVVAGWRRAIGAPTSNVAERRTAGEGWYPVPAIVEGAPLPAVGIVSWSATPRRFASLSEALRSPEAERLRPDRGAQATYYLESRLSGRHGVEFGPNDHLADPGFEATPACRAVAGSMAATEDRRISDPAFGRLDRFG